MSDLSAALRTIVDKAEPGAAELCRALENALLDSGASDHRVDVVRLKSRVYRVSAGSDSHLKSFVLKRFDPWLGRRNELVMRRWLPAIGLSDRCSHLLATAADRRGRWVWHVYEDLGQEVVDPVSPDHARVTAVADLIAELHTRAARHPMLPECRHYC